MNDQELLEVARYLIMFACGLFIGVVISTPWRRR